VPAVELEDRYELTERKEPVRLNLMTAMRVDTSTPGEVHLRAPEEQGGRHYVVVYDPRMLHATSEQIRVSDERLRSVWGDRVERIVLTTNGTALHGSFEVVLREAK
jgi:hypothetical protein